MHCSVAALHLLHAPDAVAPTTPDEPVLGEPVAAVPKAATLGERILEVLRTSPLGFDELVSDLGCFKEQEAEVREALLSIRDEHRLETVRPGGWRIPAGSPIPTTTTATSTP